MFSSVIGTLTGLLPKNFIFGAYVPTLIFTFLNFGFLYLMSSWAKQISVAQISQASPLTIAVAFVGTVVAAYVAAGLSDYMRRVFEGKYGFWIPSLTNEFRASEERRRDSIARALQRAVRLGHEISESRDIWTDQLAKASAMGKEAKAGHTGYGKTDPAHGALRELDRSRRRDRPSKDQIIDCVVLLAKSLANYDATRDLTLDADHQRLLSLIFRIEDRLLAIRMEKAQELQNMPAIGAVQPTQLGNIAAALDAYGRNVYGLDMNFLLSRLQTVFAKNDDKGFGLVLDAKMRLDFLVTSLWLTALSIAWWLLLIGREGTTGALTTYFLIAAIGPFVLAAIYMATIQSYLTYAEVLRACVDLNRLSVLEALSLPPPTSLTAEKATWKVLGELALTGEIESDLVYASPKAESARAIDAPSEKERPR